MENNNFINKNFNNLNMPNLKPWIEAQLKRGYSKSQIKKALIKKGHPLNAVAEVDIARYPASYTKTLPSNEIPKKIPSKPIALISIIVGIVFLIWLFNTLPFFSKQTTEDVVIEQESDGQIATFSIKPERLYNE